MKWGYVLAVFILLVGSAFAQAPELVSAVSNHPLQVYSREITDDGLRISLEIDEPRWESMGEEEGAPVRADFPALSGLLEVEGYPVVPTTGRLFRIPPRSGVVVEVIDAEYETYSEVDYLAYLGEHGYDGYGEIENPEDSWYPGVLADVSAPAKMRAFRVCNLHTYPVQVNMARQEVRVYSNIEVDIRFEGTDERAALDGWPTEISSTFLPWYRQFLDWDDNELDDYTLYRGNVQVVMEDHDTLWDALEPWIEWKRQKGWELEFLTDDDVNSWTASNIRNELRDRFEEAETKFDYVILVGDYGGNPTYEVPGGADTPVVGAGYGYFSDYYYQNMDDDEDPPYQDVIVSRISVRTESEAAEYANKVILYERDPYMDETDWYLRGVGMAVWDYAGTSSISTAEYVMGELDRIGYTDTPVHVSQFANQAGCISDINDGVTYYHFRGGIGAGLTLSQVNNLNNDFKLCVAVEPTCGTGKWPQENSAISEAWIRAGTVNTPKGGIVAFGLATNQTHAALNGLLATGAAHSVITMRLPELGQMVWGSQAWLYHAFADWGTYYLNFAQQWNMMGDPLCWLWTAIPEEINVDAIDTIELGSNSHIITVTDDEDNPIEGAWVTLYKVDDDEDVVVHKLTGPDGIVTLDFPVRYAGDAMLTVTVQNCIPNRTEITVVDPISRVGYENIIFVDNGTSGTIGNSNSIPEAGETVGIRIGARNYGENAESNITITATSADPFINDINGEVLIANVGAGNLVTGDSLLLVEISNEAQHDWNAVLDITIETDLDTYTDSYQLLLNAPKFGVVMLDGNENVEPGETGTVDITIVNFGGSNAQTSTAVLNILHPYGNAIEPTGDYSAINIGGEATATFEVALHPEAYNGCLTTAELIITTADNKVDTTHFSLMLGERESTDPTGPCAYGYYAFDNTDTDYFLCPEYDWVEINPDEPNNDYDGEDTEIYDPGDDQDDALMFELPFPVQYYGVEFDSITISSNGWAGFGNQMAFINSPRDYPVPGPDGAYNMLAPFWDERLVSGSSGVFHYYDEPNGRYIIEWFETNDMPTHTSNYCTFQIIIYDLVGDHITWTGDNEILFQYGAIDPTEGSGRPNPWYSIGIEAGDQATGIQYMYYREPSSGSVNHTDIDEGLAILFTTNVALITGNIEGVITDMDSGDPIDGVHIRTGNNMYEAWSGPDGSYLMEEVVIGNHSLYFTADCFNDALIDSIIVEEELTTTVDFQMVHPEVSLDLDEVFVDNIDPDGEIIVPLTLHNPGLGVLTYSTSLDFQPPEGGEPGIVNNPGGNELDQYYTPWELGHSFFLDEIEGKNRGLVFVNNHFIVSGSDNANGGANKLYKYDMWGELLAVYDQPVPEPSSVGFYGMTWDGEYLYGADEDVLYQMEFKDGQYDLIGTLELPVNPANYVAYDPDRDLFWVGASGSEIRAIDREGNLIEEFGRGDYAPHGCSWFPDDPDGYNLYFASHDRDNDVSHIYKMNAYTGDTILLHEFEDTTIKGPTGACVTNAWNPYAWTFVTIIDDMNDDFVEIFGFHDAVEYVEIVNSEGVLQPDSSIVIDLIFRGSGLPGRDYNLYLTFENDACDNENNWLPMTMRVFGEDDVDDSDLALMPLEWKFEGVYPNPFNPVTTVKFALKENSLVKARVFNLLGQQVAVLANESMTAGYHSVAFNGAGLSSGMYFLTFEAGPIREVRKLILMK